MKLTPKTKRLMGAKADDPIFEQWQAMLTAHTALSNAFMEFSKLTKGNPQFEKSRKKLSNSISEVDYDLSEVVFD